MDEEQKQTQEAPQEVAPEAAQPAVIPQTPAQPAVVGEVPQLPDQPEGTGEAPQPVEPGQSAEPPAPLPIEVQQAGQQVQPQAGEQPAVQPQAGEQPTEPKTEETTEQVQ